MAVMRVNPWTLELGEDRKTGLERWTGVGCFLTYASQAAAYARKYHGRVIHSGVGGPTAPRVRDVRIHFAPEGMKGKALLVCRAESPPPMGRARVYTRVRRMEHTVLLDLDGKTVAKTDQHSGKDSHPPDSPTGDGIHTWVITKGSNTIQLPMEEIVLETAYKRDEFDPTIGLNLYDCVNESPLGQLGRDAGTCRFIGRETDTSWGDDIVAIRYRLLWSYMPWNLLLETQKSLWAVVKQPIFDISPTTGKYSESEQTKDVIKLLPAKERYRDGSEWKLRSVGTEHRRIFEEVDFSLLDSLVVWSTK